MPEIRTDQQLVRAFLEAVEGMSQSAVGRGIPGVSQKDMSRWKSGKFQRLSGEKRKVLEEYLAEEQRKQSANGNGGQPTETPPADRLAAFWERESRSAETRARTLLTEAQALLQEAEAATVRARAYERSEINAEIRARAVSGLSPEGEKSRAGVEAAYPPGVATQLLRQILRMMEREERDRDEGRGETPPD